MKIPFLTRNQMSRLDRAAVREGLRIIQMMEHAALHTARLATRYLDRSSYVVILAGRGNNGGDGIAAARFLAHWGYQPIVILAEARRIRPDPLHHLRLVRKMDIPVFSARNEEGVLHALRTSPLIIDALLGYNLVGHPRPPYSDLIYYANAAKRKILAVDMPSGFDATSGHPAEPTIEAHATITLALPKKGFLAPSAERFIGALYIADLGIPEYVYRKARIPVPPIELFTASGLYNYTREKSLKE